MMKHACQYKIVRFAPFAETEEFANIGIIMFCPASARLEYRLAKVKFARVTRFFDDVDADVYKNVIYSLRREFARIKKVINQHEKLTAQAIFTELTRAKGGVVRFSDMRAVLTEDVDTQLNNLFDHYVGRSFNTPVYREQILEREVKNSLKQLSLDRIYKQTDIDVGLYKISMPFVRQTNGANKGVIKPLAFDQKTNRKAVEHADLWLSRAEHLVSHNVKPENMLFALDINHTNDSDLRSYLIRFQNRLGNIGIKTTDASNTDMIADFAQKH